MVVEWIFVCTVEVIIRDCFFMGPPSKCLSLSLIPVEAEALVELSEELEESFVMVDLNVHFPS